MIDSISIIAIVGVLAYLAFVLVRSQRERTRRATKPEPEQPEQRRGPKTYRGDDGGLYVLCTPCNGTGRDYVLPEGVMSVAEQVALSRSPPCPACKGRGWSDMLEPPQEEPEEPQGPSATETGTETGMVR